MSKGWFAELVERYKTWRFYREMRKEFPDPFIVCPWARECAHADGILCRPKSCNHPSYFMQAKEGGNER